MLTSKKDKDLKAVIMRGAKVTVDNPYYLIEDNGQVIFVVSSGKNGSEFRTIFHIFKI